MFNITGIDALLEELEAMVERTEKVQEATEASKDKPDAAQEIRAALLLRDKPRMIPLMDDEESARAAANDNAILDGIMLGEDLADYVTGE
jgi:hypothetical protein